LEQDLFGAALDQPDVIEPLDQLLGLLEIVNLSAPSGRGACGPSIPAGASEVSLGRRRVADPVLC
jgi:hypothetical protein